MMQRYITLLVLQNIYLEIFEKIKKMGMDHYSLYGD